MTPLRRLVAELLGTALLLAAVVGSGIMGERLSGGNLAIALLANTLATGAALTTLILTFGPNLRGSLQPRRDAGGCNPGRNPLAGSAGICRGADCGCAAWCGR